MTSKQQVLKTFPHAILKKENSYSCGEHKPAYWIEAPPDYMSCRVEYSARQCWITAWRDIQYRMIAKLES